MPKPHIEYGTASTDADLRAILSLQRDNLPHGLLSTEREREGFVTVHHSFEILKKMNDRCPHIVARHNTTIVGYALCMLREFKNDIPVLAPMFAEIDDALHRLQKIDLKYLVMGQVCIARDYRRQGLFRGLYVAMKKELSAAFDAVITEVDAINTRSSDAHKAIGFELLKTYISNGKRWELIIWEWK